MTRGSSGPPSFWSKPVVKLVAAAIVSFAIIALVLRPHGHDPDWHKHAGLRPRAPTVFNDDGSIFSGDFNRHVNDATGNDDAKHHDVHIANSHDGLPPKRGGSNNDNNAVAGHHQEQQQTHHDDAAVANDDGIHRQPGEPTTKRDANGRPIFRPLVKDKDYFSDFDITAVKMDPDPVPEAGKPHYFNYVDPATNNEYAMQYVSNEPRILAIQDFLSWDECDKLVEMATKKLFRSQVAPTIGSKDSAVNDVRTSSQAWLPAASAEVKPIVDRILKLTGMPPGANEELQILRYEKAQKYDAHNDYFDPKMYGKQSSNRAITVFLYLADVEEGGETQFPRADGKGPTFDFKSCNRGLRVHPRKGQVTIFYDMKPDGQLDPYSLHGGCPVVKGVKWGGTLWLRVPNGGHA